LKNLQKNSRTVLTGDDLHDRKHIMKLKIKTGNVKEISHKSEEMTKGRHCNHIRYETEEKELN
jgi:hypothetical protein